MAASPSKEEINAGLRKGLMALSRKLAKKGIRSSYRLFRLTIHNANVEYAEYRVLRASNGEVSGIPLIKYKDAGRVVGEGPWQPIYEWWDAFDKIVKDKEPA